MNERKTVLSAKDQLRADVGAWIELKETTYRGEDYGHRIIECLAEIEKENEQLRFCLDFNANAASKLKFAVEDLARSVAHLEALGQTFDLLGGYTDKTAEAAWHRQVTAHWKEACAALDAVVPGASDAMFFGVSNSDDMQRKVDADMDKMRRENG